MDEKEIMEMWNHRGCVFVSDEYLKTAIDILAKNGYSSLCLRTVVTGGWVIAKLF